MTRQAAIYCRISSDPTGLAAGVERQEADCRAFCEAAGWEIAEIYVDNDISAYSGKPRPAYRRMLGDVQAGKVTAIVAWHLDRLHRQPIELEEFIETCERAGLSRIKTLHGDVDLTTSSGRLHARIMGSVARHSSEHASEKIRRKLRDSAEKGKPHNGGIRSYGYEADGLTIRESEAAVIRGAVERVIAGESLRSILTDLNSRQIPTVQGVRWSFSTLRGILAGPRIAGLRTHRGKVVSEGNWPPIIDRPTHELVKAVIAARAPEKAGRPYSYLLTGGIARCGICDTPLMAKGSGRYVCSKDAGGCGRVAILAEPFEAYVWDYVLETLEDDYPVEAPAEPTAPAADLAARLAGYRERYELLTHEYAVEGMYDKPTYLALRAELTAKIEEIERELAPADQPPAGAWLHVTADDLAGAWETWDIATRRDFVRLRVAAVVVSPVEPGKPRRFDKSRIQILPLWAQKAGISAQELAGWMKPIG